MEDINDPVVVSANSSHDLIHRTRQVLLSQGNSRAPARGAPEGVTAVMEIMNYTGILSNPRRRLLTGDGVAFSPGLAAARFLYFLSGSDRLEQIEPYSGSLEPFSPDRITLGGSAHGARVFGPFCGQSLFEKCLICLREDGESNRAVIPVYQPGDTGAGPRDAPCAIAVMPYRRGSKLHMSVHMRAQEISRLMAYDIFEFTLLQEYLAASLGLDPGRYSMTAFALHDLCREASPLPRAIAQESVAPPSMAPMDPVSNTTRPEIIWWEKELRQHILAGDYGPVLSRLRSKVSPFWFDLLAAAGAHALARRYDAETALMAFEGQVGPSDELVVLRLELMAIKTRGHEKSYGTVSR